jgi:hypothetical protein
MKKPGSLTMKLGTLFGLGILSASVILSSGCANTSVTPKIKLAPRPTLAAITDDELVKTPGSVWEKVLIFGNEWEGWAEKAEGLPCVEKRRK